MSFCPHLRILRYGKIYSTISHSKMSVSAENNANFSQPCNPERTEEPINEISHELIKDRIKANLGLLNEQISTLTQLLHQLIQEFSARNSRRRTPVPDRHRRYAHFVMKPEPPESCSHEKSGVRDLRPKLKKVTEIIAKKSQFDGV